MTTVEGAGVEFSRARLRGYREGRGLRTWAELAERVDMTEDEIRALEGGSKVPTDAEVARLARALDISVSDLEATGTYSEDYADVVVFFAPPLPEEAVARLARLIQGHRISTRKE